MHIHKVAKNNLFLNGGLRKMLNSGIKSKIGQMDAKKHLPELN